MSGRPEVFGAASESTHRHGFLLVIPTYQEAENLLPLFSALDDVRTRIPLDVLIVDDGSPDGTGEMVLRLAHKRPWLNLIERDGPQGLGSAYRVGFAWALEAGYAYVGEMDADLSHDPAVVEDLLASVGAGADLAIGSRYVRGGGSEGWSRRRRALSQSANVFARLALRTGVRDSTAGYRIYSARAAQILLDEGTRCDGYGFQIEGAFLVHRAGLPIQETPIVFRERERGYSKMSSHIVFEAAGRVLRLAMSRPHPRPRTERHFLELCEDEWSALTEQASWMGLDARSLALARILDGTEQLVTTTEEAPR